MQNSDTNMVNLNYEIQQPKLTESGAEDMPESALSAELKYAEDLQFLRELVSDAISFVQEGLVDEDDEDIIAEADAKVRFVLDFYEYQVDSGLKGKLKDFVRSKKQRYPKPGMANTFTNEIFGCNFNTVTNVLTSSKKNLNLTDEENEIWEKVRRGDTESINSIIQENEMLIRKVIMQLYGEYVINGTFSYEDLHNEGILGLRKAVIKYNPRFGYRFSTSAYNWIRSYVSGYIYKNLNTLHYPINMVSRSESSGRGILHLDAPVDGDDSRKSFHNVVGLDCPEFEKIEEDDFQRKLRQEVTEQIYNFDFSQVGYRSLDRDLAFYITMRYFFEEPSATLKQIANSWGNTKRTGKPYSIEAIRKFKEAIVESFKHNSVIINLLID